MDSGLSLRSDKIPQVCSVLHPSEVDSQTTAVYCLLMGLLADALKIQGTVYSVVTLKFPWQFLYGQKFALMFLIKIFPYRCAVWCVSVNCCPPFQTWLDYSGAVLHAVCELLGHHSEWKVLYNVKTRLCRGFWATTSIQGMGWMKGPNQNSFSVLREVASGVEAVPIIFEKEHALWCLSFAGHVFIHPAPSLFDSLWRVGHNNDIRSSFSLYLGKARTGTSYSLLTYSLWATGLGQLLLYYSRFPFLSIKAH